MSRHLLITGGSPPLLRLLARIATDRPDRPVRTCRSLQKDVVHFCLCILFLGDPQKTDFHGVGLGDPFHYTDMFRVNWGAVANLGGLLETLGFYRITP